MRIGGIELGGTKIVLAAAEAEAPERPVVRRVIPTTDPDDNIAQIIGFFTEHPVAALGIGSFGPVDLDPASPAYGSILKTPKLLWRNTELLKRLKAGLKIPMGFDTDVNAAVYGEVRKGAARGCGSAVYVTVGTGIGFGVYLNGALLHGLRHPEGGHMLLAKAPEDRDFTCVCPCHSSCLEGLASGPAIEKRWGRPGGELYDDERVWALEADYLGMAAANIIMLYSPEKLILGGGVMHAPGLIEKVRERTVAALGDYIDLRGIDLSEYIIPPALGDDAGIAGALLLGLDALNS